MIVRTLQEILDTPRHAKGPGWESRRLLLKPDGLGYSLHDTIVKEGAELHLHYKHHTEANYCFAGEGEVVEVARHEFDPEDTRKVQRADLTPLFAGLVAPGQTGPRYKVSVALGKEREKQDGGGSILDPRASSLVIGGRGEAKVTTERITLGRWLYRFLAQTFRLPM